ARTPCTAKRSPRSGKRTSTTSTTRKALSICSACLSKSRLCWTRKNSNDLSFAARGKRVAKRIFCEKLKMVNVFIDGKEGTTGLQIFERLGKRNDVSIVTLPEELRK